MARSPRANLRRAFDALEELLEVAGRHPMARADLVAAIGEARMKELAGARDLVAEALAAVEATHASGDEDSTQGWGTARLATRRRRVPGGELRPPSRPKMRRLVTPVSPPAAHEIQAVISRYAVAYAELQAMQERSPLIPMGDQKTGSIGEFYARLYLEGRYPDAEIEFGRPGVSGWDLEVRPRRDAPFRIQVKTVSAFSKTRRISPIYVGWDQLYLLYLGMDFGPLGFWVLEDNAVMDAGPLRHCCCPDPVKARGGSARLGLGANRVEELLAIVAPRLRAI